MIIKVNGVSLAPQEKPLEGSQSDLSDQLIDKVIEAPSVYQKVKEIQQESNADIAKDNSIFDSMGSFMEFINSVKEDGFFHTVYGKSFFEVCKDFFSQLFHDIGSFILGNGDAFFLAPAILFMFVTFVIGKNRTTKWIIPCWFAYLLSTIFYRFL